MNKTSQDTFSDILDGAPRDRSIEEIRELASRHSDDSVAQFCAGCAELGVAKFKEAAEFFEKAVAADSSNTDAYHNLALARMQLNDAEGAIDAFEAGIASGVAGADMWHDLAVVHISSGNRDSARKCLRKALKLDENHHLSKRAMLELCESDGDVRRARRYLKLWGRSTEAGERKLRKLAVISSNAVFMKDIIAKLESRYEVTTYNPRTVGELKEALVNSDVAWFEWCDELLIQATKHLPKLCPIICRLHSYEAFGDAPEQVDWTKVDRVVFVNKSVQALLHGRIPESVGQQVIANAVDVGRFRPSAKKLHGKRIASVGYINYKKNPQLLLYCFAKLKERHPDVEIHIAGEHQDSRIRLYMDDMSRKLGLELKWHGRVADMPGFYASMDFVISTSLFESFHYSIAEGMACGLTPLVHHWFGAEGVYPEKWLFRTPDECVELFERALESDRDELAKESRSFIEDRYSLESQIEQIEELIEETVSAGRTRGNTMPDYGTVSIIIPTYNRADLLPEAISSAMSQTYPNCEIVVVDDGSTDNTQEVLDRYKEECGDKLVVVRQENKGVSAALNTAIKHSSGEYISWLSSDDAYHPEKVWENIKILGEQRDIDWVYSDFYYMTHDSQITGQARPEVLTPENIVNKMFEGNPIHGCSVMFRRSNLETTGLFDEELGGKIGYGADGAMWHKMGSHFKFAYIDKPLVYYRLHPGQVTHQADIPKSQSEYREYMEEYFANAAKPPAGVQKTSGKTMTKREWLIDVISRMMEPCDSVLELGAGHFEMIGALHATRRTGVEIHQPYIDRRVCDDSVEVIQANALDADKLFDEKSYDGVMMIDFIEHVEKETALQLLDTAEKLARKQTLVHCPLGRHPQEEDAFDLGGEEYQKHRSEWEPEDFKRRGYETLVIEDFFSNKPDCDPRAIIALKRTGQQDIYKA